MVWMNEQELTVTPVIGMVRTQSNKGYIVKGSDFDVFLWNSDNLLKFLLIAMASWVDSGQGKQLEIKADKALKRGFNITVAVAGKKEVLARYRLLQNGYEVIPEGEEIETNPFL